MYSLESATQMIQATRHTEFSVTSCLIPGLKKLPYEKILQHLGLWTLEERRNRSDLLEVFRMYKGLSLITFNQFFVISPVVNTRGHTAKIMKSRCQLDLRRFSFLSGLLTSGMDCNSVKLTVLSRIVSAECDRRRWVTSWTNQIAWPSRLISSDVFGPGAAAPGKLPGNLHVRLSNV